MPHSHRHEKESRHIPWRERISAITDTLTALARLLRAAGELIDTIRDIMPL